jgi:hypothetical protein
VAGGKIDVQDGVQADAFWRGYLTRSGGWLSNEASWTNVSTLAALVAAFPDVVAKGVVLYDPTVPATSNLASTAAGVEGLRPVCYRPGEAGSVYEQLVGGGPKLPVALNLTAKFAPADGATAKLLAYRWARARWLAPGVPASRRANPAKLGYYVDYWAALQVGIIISDCHFRKTATEYYRKPGIKLLSCTAK